MHPSKEIQAAHVRIAVLTAHLASGHAGSVDILEVLVRKSSLTPALSPIAATNKHELFFRIAPRLPSPGLWQWELASGVLLRM